MVEGSRYDIQFFSRSWMKLGGKNYPGTLQGNSADAQSTKKWNSPGYIGDKWEFIITFKAMHFKKIALQKMVK